MTGSVRRDALRFALYYALFGAIWVLGTDLLAQQLARNEVELRRISTVKGWFFVLVSTGLIFALAYRYGTIHRRAVRAARRSEHRFRALMEGAPDMIFWLADPDFGEVQYISPTIRGLWGCSPEEVYADPGVLRSCVHPDDRGRFLEDRRPLLAGEAMDREFRIVRPDGQVRWMRSQGYPIKDEAVGLEGVAGVTQDITGRKQAFEDLRHSEELLRQAQRIGRIGHWERKLPDGLLTWSEEVYRILGEDPDAFTPSYEAFLERIHPEDREAQRSADAAALAGEEPLDIENRIVRPDGEVRYVHARATLVDDGKAGRRYVGIVHDVTQRRRLQAALERSHENLRQYAASRTVVRERERIALAREIHDELGQLLTAIKLQLAQEMRTAEGEQRERLAETEGVVESAIAEVRHLATRLRPPVLDQLGLVDALEAHVADVASRADFELVFVSDFERLSLDHEAATHMFRIAQEALTNVARHSGATRARVELRREDGGIVLRILDDGVGLPAEQLEQIERHGLVGMRERALLLGGTLGLVDRDGDGLEVRVRVPHPEAP